MKTADDKLNEALREALKRKFDHYEDTPGPSAFEKIRMHVKPGRQWKYLFFTLLFVGIAIVGVKTDQYYLANNVAERNNRVQANHIATKAVINGKTTQIQALKYEAKQSKASLQASVAVKNITRKENGAAAVLIASIDGSKSTNKVAEPIVAATKNLVTDSITTSAGDAEILRYPSFDLTVHPFSIHPAQFTAANLTLPGIKSSENTSIHHKPIANKITWLVNAAVLQSYQLLTVPSGSQEFQNFEFPSTFSLRSMGYKMSVGVDKNGFQLQMNYSYFRQAYSYEIAGNEYVVQNPEKDYTSIRQGKRVNQEREFRLLGIGISKQFRWGRPALGQYYALAGLEYAHSLHAYRDIGWVNAGFGKEFPLSQGFSLQIGPYAEFSPVRLSGPTDPFTYQPYRVGISAGLRLKR